MKIKYCYTSNIYCAFLEDGTTDKQLTASMDVSGKADINDFLDILSDESQIGYITNLEYSIEA